MKTYTWMAAKRGNAHLCERANQTDAPKPVCGARVAEALEACGSEKTKCGTCVKMEKEINRYLAAMGQKTI